MKFEIVQLGKDFYSNYWLYPLLLTAVLLFLLFLGLKLDSALPQFFLQDEYRLFKLDHEGMRKLLTIISTTSITITSLTFSITVLTLSLASNQLGPRLLPNFIQQGRTQFVIGLFVSIYIYCMTLLLLSSTDYFSGHPFFISLYLGILLAIFSFFVLIYFIHFVCHAIQVNHFLDYLSKEIDTSIHRLADNHHDELDAPYYPSNQVTQLSQGKNICAMESGYIKTIDLDALNNIAAEKQIVIKVLKRPGHYLYRNLPVATLYHCDILDPTLEKTILNTIKTGVNRSTVQDIEFGFDQISEIAIRALSPGINNPYTAITCIDRIGDLLQTLATIKLPTGYLLDENHKLLVIYRPFTYKGIIDISLNQLRECGITYVSVTIELLRLVDKLIRLKPPYEMISALRAQAKIIVEQAAEQGFHASDLAIIEKTYANISRFR